MRKMLDDAKKEWQKKMRDRRKEVQALKRRQEREELRELKRCVRLACLATVAWHVLRLLVDGLRLSCCLADDALHSFEPGCTCSRAAGLNGRLCHRVVS